jgi:septal ring factor EnvC (AmiA/AmiB activator)
MTAAPPAKGMSPQDAQTALLAAQSRIEQLEGEVSEARAVLADLPAELEALRAASIARRRLLQEVLGLMSGNGG